MEPIETTGSTSSMAKKKDPLRVALTGVLELQNTGGLTRRAIGAGTNVNKSSLETQVRKFPKKGMDPKFRSCD